MVWGLWMAFFTGGPLLLWLFFGLLWGAAVWFVTSILLVILCREISASIPLQDAATLPERLAVAAKHCRYSVEQVSPMRFVCQSKRGLGRFISFEYTKIHVEWRDGRVFMIGPSGIVTKIAKKLLEDSKRS